jgi:hypothetical protein
MGSPDILDADRDRVLAFRLGGHNLASRQPPGSLLKAAGACGVQNTPPGSAALSLHARVNGLTPADVDLALEADRTLLQTFSLRGATYVFPTADSEVFMQGILPQDEESLRFFITGAVPAFDKIGMSAAEAVRRTSRALFEVLDGRAMPKRELAPELADRVSGQLSSRQLAEWKSPSWYAPDLLLGEAVVRFCLYIVALEGSFCFATRHNAATYIRTDQWLGAPLPEADLRHAQAELVRRYLSCYGPSTSVHFAEWAGVSPLQAARAWRLLEEELMEVDFEGRDAWLLRRDLPRLMSPHMPEGVRFLPPHDPYLQLRDRETLIADKTLQRHIWRAVGNPGIVLAEGKPVAMWRPLKKSKSLHLKVELFDPISPGIRRKIEAEATTLAPYRNCASTEVEFKQVK